MSVQEQLQRPIGISPRLWSLISAPGLVKFLGISTSQETRSDMWIMRASAHEDCPDGRSTDPVLPVAFFSLPGLAFGDLACQNRCKEKRNQIQLSSKKLTSGARSRRRLSLKKSTSRGSGIPISRCHCRTFEGTGSLAWANELTGLSGNQNTQRPWSKCHPTVTQQP